MKGFIALDSHPAGCARQVENLVDRIRADEPTRLTEPRPVVVIGSSGGYGLPSVVAAAFRYRMPVVGVCLERPATRGRTASAGWYNVVALHEQAERHGASVTTLNADGFADATKSEVVEHLSRLGPPSLLVYSLASPVRTDPKSGTTYRSVLKPVGAPFTTTTVKLDTGDVVEATIPAATDEEIAATVKVMGGEDWAGWVDALDAAGLIDTAFRTVAFDYIGPEATYPIYRSGSIGQAKADLEQTAQRLHKQMPTKSGGAWASANAAAVTQSSTAIPAVPLYLSLLLAVAGERGTFETPAEQMRRLFDDYLMRPDVPSTDDAGRIRLDEWELDPDVQAEIADRWRRVDDENLPALADFAGFQRQFRQLFGFDVPGIDYDSPVDPSIPFPPA